MPSITTLYPVGSLVEVYTGEWTEGTVTSHYNSDLIFVTMPDGLDFQLTEYHKDSIRMKVPPKPRENSFKNWMNKLEGKKDDHYFTTQKTGGGFGEGIDLLHQWLQRHIKFRDFQSRRGSLDLEERQALDRERARLGVLYSAIDPLGLYNGDRSAYQQSVEYLTGNQTSQRQDDFPSTPYVPTHRFSAYVNNAWHSAFSSSLDGLRSTTSSSD